MYLGTQLFITLVILVLGLKLYLNYRQLKSIQANFNEVPLNFKHLINLEEHQKAGRYNIAKLKLARLEHIFTAIIILGFTIGGGIQWINDLLDDVLLFEQSIIFKGVTVIALYMLISTVLNLPFSIYSTFYIEQKFGFNNMTLKLFITDLIKGLLLGAIIGLPLLYLVLWLIGAMGEFWWIWTWIFLVVFNLLIMVIYPIFIAPIFNKFTLLSDTELKERIDKLLARCGFKSKGVFVMDGSKRSNHGNAYFTGIGKSKRIVFFDTLIKQLSPEQIEAVLAHELGHFKKKHIIKQIGVTFLLTFIMLFILSNLIDHSGFYNILGVSSIENYNGILLFMLVMELVTFPFSPLSNYFSRKNEFEADDFAVAHTNKEHLIGGLISLYRDNASTLTPDSLYVKFYYSHPPASIRIANLEK